MPPNEGPRSLAVATRVYRYDVGASGAEAMREIAVETPIEIAFGGAPFAVMMATAADLEDFAFGFALTEGIVESINEIRAVEASVDAASARVNVSLTSDRMRAHLARKRAMSGRTGCGVCGIEDLAHLPQPLRRITASRPVSPAAIKAAIAALETAQPLNAKTRAVHAAAWCARDGAILAVREDVGRHNALDKLIGARLRAGADPTDGFVVITSRCSFEMVAKTAAFGAQTLVSLSAPTSLALTRAEESGIALIAIARADQASSFGTVAVDSDRGAAA